MVIVLFIQIIGINAKVTNNSALFLISNWFKILPNKIKAIKDITAVAVLVAIQPPPISSEFKISKKGKPGKRDTVYT